MRNWTWTWTRLPTPLLVAAALSLVGATFVAPQAAAASGESPVSPPVESTASTPASTAPDRAYGFWAEDAYGDLAALRLSGDGRNVTFASVHLSLWCGDAVQAQLGTRFRIATHAPTARELLTDDVLVVQPRQGGTIRTSVYADRRFADGLQQLRGTLDLSRVRNVTVDAKWRIGIRWRPTDGAPTSCVSRGQIQPIRDPGVLFAGSTTDLEPAVALRRVSSAGAPAAAVLLGYDARCKTHWDPWAVVIDAFVPQPDETFTTGETKTLRGLVFPSDWDAYYRLSGQFTGDTVAGHLELNARVFDEPRTCRTDVTFTAQTG